jgi:FSR family fosmidomycin resistance protein-like MFS transporter
MVRYGRLAALVFGHFLTDGYMGMVLPLLPVIREHYGLSLAQVGLVTICTSLTGSLVQPLLGVISDRTRRSYLVGLGVVLTGVGICTFGRAGTFAGTMALIALGGLGCGAFHPAGSALASAAGGERRDMTQGLFSPGGIVGYSLGPLAGMWLYHRGGLGGMWPGMLAGLIAGPLILAASLSLERLSEREHSGPPPPMHDNGALMSRRYRAFALGMLTVVVLLRSVLVIVFLSFLALFLESRGVSESRWDLYLMAFVFAGGIAGLFGGHLARYMGRRLLTIVTLALTGPLLLAFLHTRGIAAWGLLILAGALSQAAVPVNIVQAQLLLPRHQSLASAIMMGFCWGAASFLAPAFGHLADERSLLFALSLCCVTPVAGAAAALFIPDLRPPAGMAAPAEPPALPPSPIGGDGGSC